MHKKKKSEYINRKKKKNMNKKNPSLSSFRFKKKYQRNINQYKLNNSFNKL